MARTTKLLQPKDVYVDPPNLAFVKPNLLRRDMIRTSTFRVDGFGAEDHTYGFDRDYEVRATPAAIIIKDNA
jgi:hypothetical protein